MKAYLKIYRVLNVYSLFSYLRLIHKLLNKLLISFQLVLCIKIEAFLYIRYHIVLLSAMKLLSYFTTKHTRQSANTLFI